MPVVPAVFVHSHIEKFFHTKNCLSLFYIITSIIVMGVLALLQVSEYKYSQSEVEFCSFVVLIAVLRYQHLGQRLVLILGNNFSSRTKQSRSGT